MSPALLSRSRSFGARFGASLVAAIIAVLGESETARALQVRVTIENLAPQHGTFLTPLWVGFHDGSFDLYDVGATAAGFLESLSEDGSTGPVTSEFAGSGAGSVQGTLVGPTIPPLAPGELASMVFELDPGAMTSRYFSYASMIIPSNDAFIANGNPLAFEIVDAGGVFLGANFFVTGAQVLDAGTEVNDELPANTAFFGQAAPNTGVTENGVIGGHPGFSAAAAGGILADPQFANGDFSLAGYPIAQIRVSAVPLPAAVVMLSSALGALGFSQRRMRA